MTYRFLTPAIREIAEAAGYYDSRVPGLGADFLDEMESAIERILNFPEAWSMIAPPFRHCSLRRFPYSIFTLYPRAKAF
jgi:hypothetical protein